MAFEELLKKSEVFKDLTADELKQIAALGREQDYKAGTVVLKEGGTADEFYVVIEGEFRVQICLGAGVECVHIATLHEGQVFGWSCMIGIPRLRGTVVAVQDSKALVFKCLDLKRLYAQKTRIGYHVMRALAVVISERLEATRFGLGSCIINHGGEKIG